MILIFSPQYLGLLFFYSWLAEEKRKKERKETAKGRKKELQMNTAQKYPYYANEGRCRVGNFLHNLDPLRPKNLKISQTLLSDLVISRAKHIWEKNPQ